jgi:hypothetical protein
MPHAQNLGTAGLHSAAHEAMISRHIYKPAFRVVSPVMYRMSYKAFPKDQGRQMGIISDEDKGRIAAMSVAAVLAEVAANTISGKRAITNRKKGFRGVSKRSSSWLASINVGNIHRYLGSFPEAVAAARAYDAEAWRLHGRCAHGPVSKALGTDLIRQSITTAGQAPNQL